MRLLRSKSAYSMHTMDDILYALRSLNVICIGDGKGYLPDYKDSNVITEFPTRSL